MMYGTAMHAATEFCVAELLDGRTPSAEVIGTDFLLCMLVLALLLFNHASLCATGPSSEAVRQLGR